MPARRDYVRTDKMIKEAYTKLLFEKNNIGRITVNDILTEADISRGTFYAHYKDIPDLAEHVLEGITESFVQELAGKTLRQIIDDPREEVDHILGVLMERKDILAAVMSETESPRIIFMIKNLFMEALARERLAQSKMEIVNFVDACVAGAAFDACMMWLKDDNGISREEFVEIISTFLSGGLGRIYPA